MIARDRLALPLFFFFILPALVTAEPGVPSAKAIASQALPAAAVQAAPLPKDVRWIRKSSEYFALCVQTYREAQRAVRQTAKKERKNWVVVLDIDETVLDNSQYQIELFSSGTEFTLDSWAAWVKRREAGTVPGAKAFLDSVRGLGRKAHVAFISNRDVSLDQDTIENMKRLGLFRDGDIMLSKTGKDDTKEVRRQCLTSGAGRCAKYGPMPIVALLGDQIRDFMELTKPEQIQELRDSKIADDTLWGQKYFMLPNPMYGDWGKL